MDKGKTKFTDEIEVERTRLADYRASGNLFMAYHVERMIVWFRYFERLLERYDNVCDAIERSDVVDEWLFKEN